MSEPHAQFSWSMCRDVRFGSVLMSASKLWHVANATFDSRKVVTEGKEGSGAGGGPNKGCQCSAALWNWMLTSCARVKVPRTDFQYVQNCLLSASRRQNWTSLTYGTSRCPSDVWNHAMRDRRRFGGGENS